jgi:hypothetical protein
MSGVNARDLIDEIRSGIGDQRLIKKYGLSQKRLRRLLERLLKEGAIGHEELCERSETYRKTVERLAARRSPRLSVPAPLSICLPGSNQRGFIRDISEKGIRVAGVEASVGQVVRLQLPPQAWFTGSAIEFDGVCRWCRTKGKDIQYSVSGFEVTRISDGARERFTELLELVRSQVQDRERRARTTEELPKAFRPAREPSTERREREFSGYIAGVDILEFVQFLLLGGRSLLLRLYSLGGQVGEVHIDHGEIVHAALGNLSPEEALFECLNFLGGEFSVEPSRTKVTRTIHKPGDLLLMEAARPRDEETDLVTAGSFTDQGPAAESGL